MITDTLKIIEFDDQLGCGSEDEVKEIRHVGLSSGGVEYYLKTFNIKEGEFEVGTPIGTGKTGWVIPIDARRPELFCLS